MELLTYRDTDNLARVALIANEGRKWMSVLIVKDGGLKIVRRELGEKKYMAPCATNERKAKASIRRLARKAGTPRKIRNTVKEVLA
ncbi:MAG: hypothetical protein ACYSW6_10010 [Planctomycetota bacterium]|jgi:hypothetical protein